MFFILIGFIVVILMALPITLTLSGILDRESDLTFSISYGGIHWRKKWTFDLMNLPQALFLPKSSSFESTEVKMMQKPATKKTKAKKMKNSLSSLSWQQYFEDFFPYVKKSFDGFFLHHLEVDYTLGLGHKDKLGMIAGVIWGVIGAFPQLEKKSIFLHFTPDFEKNGQLLAINGMILVPLGHIIVSCLFFIGLYGKRLLGARLQGWKRSAHCG